MTAINRGASPDGRINLEQQKKRAKELLKAHAAGDADAQARFAEHVRATEPKLADAQHVIARESGFVSWPKLKTHAEALAAARAAMAHAPDTPATLHIRCGSDIRQTLVEAGFSGHFHEFADPFCQGPVRDLSRPAFVAERHAFLEAAYGVRPAGHGIDGAYAILDKLAGYAEIVLWSEHDSYDQLILAFLLSEFGKHTDLPPVKLVCVDKVPATRRFIGLGQLGPDVLRWLWQSRRELDTGTFQFGDKVWRALTSPDPRALHAIAAAGTPLVPPMAGALKRHLMELPSSANGLSLLERLALEIIGERGEIELRALFSPYQEREPLPFIGDTMFVENIRLLAAAESPVITLSEDVSIWRRKAALTDTGRRVLSGAQDWLGCWPKQRWVGGVEIRPDEASWRYDHARDAIVRS